MNYITFAPCEELKDFVSPFWAGRLSTDLQPNFIYQATANTNTELAFAFKPSPGSQPELVFSSVLGHTSGFGQFPANRFVDIVGVSLFSYAVPQFLNVSAVDLFNQFTDLGTVLGNKGKMIEEKMTTAPNTHAQIKVLSDYFKSQFTRKEGEDKLIIKAIQEIRKYHGILSVKQLASACCLSEKQFERRFTSYSGFKPKLYSRIIRFESALWLNSNIDNYTKIAHNFGYYDQSHFIRDFKTFTGFAPGKFMN